MKIDLSLFHKYGIEYAWEHNNENGQLVAFIPKHIGMENVINEFKRVGLVDETDNMGTWLVIPAEYFGADTRDIYPKPWEYMGPQQLKEWEARGAIEYRYSYN